MNPKNIYDNFCRDRWSIFVWCNSYAFGLANSIADHPKVTQIKKSFVDDFKETTTLTIRETAKQIKETNDTSVSRRPVGLPNVGSTCYMNSIIQCLCWSPCILDLLAEEFKESRKINEEGMTECLMMLLHALNQTDKDCVDKKLVKALLNSAREINDQFLGYHQQDSFEIFNTILSGIEDSTTPPKDNGETAEDSGYECNKVVRLFTGKFVIVYYYSDCEHVQLVQQKHTSLSIPSPCEGHHAENKKQKVGKENKDTTLTDSQTDKRSESSSENLKTPSQLSDKVEEYQAYTTEDSTNYPTDKCQSSHELVDTRGNENIYDNDEMLVNGDIQKEGSSQRPLKSKDNVTTIIINNVSGKLKVNSDEESNIEVTNDQENTSDQTLQSNNVTDSQTPDGRNVSITNHGTQEDIHVDRALTRVEADVPHGERMSVSDDQRENMKQICEIDIPLALSLTGSTATDSSGVEKGLEILTKVEMFPTTRLNCRDCEQHKQENKDNTGVCYKVLRLYELPPVLVLHINRFRQVEGKLEKVQERVSYPKELDISRFCSSFMEQGEGMYALYGVASHRGKITGGHYYAFVKTNNRAAEEIRKQLDKVDATTPKDMKEDIEKLIKAKKDKSTQHILPKDEESKKCSNSTSTDNRWYTISDSSCREVTEEDVLSDSNAYVLMYERI